VKRVITLFIVAALLLPVTPALAGGAFNPPMSGTLVVNGPKVDGTIVLDTHEPLGGFTTPVCTVATSSGNNQLSPRTTTGKQGTITLRSGSREATALFNAPSTGFPLACGCDLALTATRFENAELSTFIGPHFALVKLFGTLGIIIDPDSPGTMKPIITKITGDQCAPATGTDAGALNPGYLVVDFVVEFLEEPKH
jgi:hypothetical protein